jgi:hypothetical protein
MKTTWKPLGLAILLLCAVAFEAVAQSTGVLRGVVTDQAGVPLPGATVAVESPQTGGGRGAVTDQSGQFQIAGLPSGVDYTLRFTLDGYASVVLTQVEVYGGRIITQTVVLPPESQLREKVEVRATPPVVSLAETTTQTRFSSEFVDALPVLGRNYQDVLTLAPGVNDIDGDGNPNIHGARDTDVGTLVDGVSTSDPLTGKVGAQLNIESIQEIELKTSGATAEYGRAQGGFANILTKTGGNEFEGAFKFFWRGSALDGDGAGSDDPSMHGNVGEQGLRDLEFNDFLPFVAAGGPFVKDRAWYYVALEYISKDEPVNALNTAFVAGIREFRGFGKATWQVSPAHRVALSLNVDPQEYLNEGLNSFTREESGYTRLEGGTNVTLKGVSVLSPTVVLESAFARFESRPENDPNLGPDTNGNGVLYYDRNNNGFREPGERDPGEDWDADGAFDVYEDTHIRNGRIDTWKEPNPVPDPQFPFVFLTEDVDGDRRLTPIGACEGALREDIDCDGHLDRVNEDTNGNGVLDAEEDVDSDNRLDLGAEDRNLNRQLDDVPFPSSSYPFGTTRPLTLDRDFLLDERTGVISGPYYQNYDDRRRRLTLREDLSVFVPDFLGTHDVKGGFLLERESFDRVTETRDITALQPEEAQTCPPGGSAEDCVGGRAPAFIALIPTRPEVEGEASGMNGALYVQDSFKPLPNLNLGVGLRFEREAVHSQGYTYFEPDVERGIFDRLINLSEGEAGQYELLYGNRDGIVSAGIKRGDPLFFSTDTQLRDTLVDTMKFQSIRRLTRNPSLAQFTVGPLATLFPDIFQGDEIDPVRLSELGVTIQVPEPIDITNNNLSPRLSVSWDPWSDGRTKVFATWGRYYDKLFLNTIVGEQAADPVARYYQIDPDGLIPSFQNGRVVQVPNHFVGGVISKSPPTIHQVDRTLQTPFSDEATFGFERELAPEVALAVRFIRRDFRDQLQDVDVNHEVSIDPNTGEPSDYFGVLRLRQNQGGRTQLERSQDGRPDLFVNNLFFNQVLRVGNYNEGKYSAIELELERRQARRWELHGSYTYSRAQGQAEEFQSRAGNDPSVIESEYGYLDFDQRHVVKLNGSVYLPADWQMAFVSTWASGLPYSVVSRFFAADNVAYSQFRTRYGYTDPATFRFVPLPRNSERNDAVFDLNLRARKNFVIGKSAAALSLEVFNVLNTDDLRILTYEPIAGSGFDVSSGANVASPLQIDATRRFGRRFQVGFQISF